MNYSSQKAKLDQLNPTLLQNLSDEQASIIEGGAIVLSLIFITAELDRSSTKNKGAAGIGLGVGGG